MNRPDHPPKILLLCGTRRGLAFTERFFNLMPGAKFTVCSFREEPWEPRFLGDIEALVKGHGQEFVVCKDLRKAEGLAHEDFDLLFAVNWRTMVPPSFYRAMKRGAYVFHDSLLPKYRGFSPTVWAMINGDSETGATLLEMDESADHGRIVDQIRVPIDPREFVASVTARVTNAYLLLLERNLAQLLSGNKAFRVQEESQATYACKRVPEDNRILWDWAARRIFDLIRASSHPYPGAFCFLKGKKLIVWRADPPEGSKRYAGSVPGRLVERVNGEGARILAGADSVFIREVQWDNAPVVTADALLTSLADTLT